MASSRDKRIAPFVFQPFSEKQMKLLTWWQDNSPVQDKFMVVSDGSIRSGKKLANSCLIPTPNGMKRNGDLEVGDYVFDRAGKKTKILEIFPHKADKMYKITFNDGSSTICSKEHLWTFYDGKEIVTKELQEFMDKSYVQFQFPLNGCVDFESRKLYINPYIAGEVIERYDCDIHYEFNDKEEIDTFDKYGLYDLEDFRIHEDFRFNSVVARKELLTGILCVARDNGRVDIEEGLIRYYSFTNKLLEDVVFIARSLGLYVKEYSNMCEIFGAKYTENDVSYLAGNYFRTIVGIDYYGEEDATCILVDNEEHLYLCDDFIVTHNTVVCALSFILYVMTHFNFQNTAIAGKAQPLDSKILTPKGYVKMGEIEVGDWVYSREGKKVKVSGVYPQGRKETYRITFTDGSSTKCSAEHLWSYKDSKNNIITETLNEIMEHEFDEMRFPINKAIEFSRKEVAIPPYIIGSLLETYELGQLVEEEMRCLSKYRKRILEEYKYNSEKVRRELLDGIMDKAEREGKAKFGEYIEFNAGEELLKEVIFIARSLGLYVEEKEGSCIIYPDGERYRIIKSIDYIGEEECQCIYVEDEEHLYLTDDLIVTHNTVMSVRRNVLNPLKQMLLALGYEIIEHRNENYVEIIKDEVCNFVYLFGGKDESSQDLVQGLTLASLFIDKFCRAIGKPIVV